MDWNKDEIEYMREGLVSKEAITDIHCCNLSSSETEILRYLEVVYRDGSRKFVYQNQEGFQEFENNWYQNRFTSFHEFLTTEEEAVEERGVLSLKYYKRRGPESYVEMDLQEAREELQGVREFPARITEFGKYDGKVNYHLD
ncbi:MAG: hypothetical protein K6G62_01965 [Eubacterium sp.]|nr:hypothetical protein [Eubacterium sp.]